MFTPFINERIRNHAIAEYPRESVGAVVVSHKTKRITYKPLTNVSKDPNNHFSVEAKQFAALNKNYKVLGVVHSHPDGDRFPSKTDMVVQEAYNIPFGIVTSSGGKHGAAGSASDPIWWSNKWDQVPMEDLYGRTFVPGIWDCFTYIRDLFYKEKNIQLRMEPRRDNWWLDLKDEKGNVIAPAENMYVEGMAPNGFKRVITNDLNDLQPYDIILMRIRGKIPNHAAVYLGGDQLGHHLAGELSRKETGVMRWAGVTVSYWRHETLWAKEEDQ